MSAPGSFGGAERRAERRYQIQVQRDLTRNFLIHLLHGMLGQTGFRLINAPTFMPAYIMMLSGGSDVAVGLALSLQAFGMTTTPLLGANLIEHRHRVLPLGFVIGGGMRVMVLCIGLTGLLLQDRAALVAIMIFMTLFGVFAGMQGVVFNFLMSKVIPVTKRGRLTGMRNFLAGITSAGVAWMGGEFLIGDPPTASGYSYTFILAFLLTSIGLMSLMFMREPQPPTVRPKQSFGTLISQLPQLLRDEPSFARYVAARALATMGRMALPFYILYAGRNIGLTGETLGLVTFAFTLAATGSNLVWGALSDRRGFRLTFLASIILWIGSTIFLMTSEGLLNTVIVFIGIGAAVQGFQNASVNLTLEFGHREDLPVRIAIANMASELAGTLGPLLGGILAAVSGYTEVFAVSIAFLVIGGVMVSFYVPEPRKTSR